MTFAEFGIPVLAEDARILLLVILDWEPTAWNFTTCIVEKQLLEASAILGFGVREAAKGQNDCAS